MGAQQSAGGPEATSAFESLLRFVVRSDAVFCIMISMFFFCLPFAVVLSFAMMLLFNDWTIEQIHLALWPKLLCGLFPSNLTILWSSRMFAIRLPTFFSCLVLISKGARSNPMTPVHAPMSTQNPSRKWFCKPTLTLSYLLFFLPNPIF
jgi:hypothetical protein